MNGVWLRQDAVPSELEFFGGSNQTVPVRKSIARCKAGD
jgi:hypothetical protein